MRDFRQIKVWAKAHYLTLNIYKATSSFPRQEIYGLVSQLRRCSASIAANIAEGYGRGGNTELARFLQIGMGSASELEYHILLSKALNFVTKTVYDELQSQVVEVKKMLGALLVKVRADR
jgi:four helix bundle protein